MSRRSVYLTSVAVLATLIAACGPLPEDQDEAFYTPSETLAVSAEDAQTALSAFGLETPGAASWADRRFENGAYIFEAFRLNTEDEASTADRMILHGPRNDDGNPMFNALELINLENVSEDGAIQIQAVSLTNPSPALALNIASRLRGELDFDSESPTTGHGFGQLNLEGVQVTLREGKTTQNMSFGQFLARNLDSEFLLESVSLNDFEFSTTDSELGPISLTFRDFSASDINLESVDPDAPYGLMIVNPDDAPFTSFSIADMRLNTVPFNVAMSTLTATIDSLEGGVLSSRTHMDSLTVAANPDSPESAEFHSILNQLGYEQFEFSMVGDSRYDPQADRAWTVGENALTMTDGFTLRFEQDLGGIIAYSKAMQAFSETEGEALTFEQALAPLIVNRLIVELEDQSLLERAIAVYSQQNGTDPELARNQAASMMVLGLGFAGAQLPSGFATEAATALNGFLEHGGTLVLEIAPETPVSMSVLAEEPLPSADEIGLSIRHENPSNP